MSKRPDLSRSKLFQRHFVDFQAHGHNIYKVFEDFLELTTLSFCNASPIHDERRKEREERYLTIASKYKKGLIDLFPKMLSDLIATIEQGENDDVDTLGEFFQEFVTGGENGQFFTPMHVARMMSQLTVPDGIPDGSTVCDPACGSGRTLITALEKNRKIVVTGCDLDRRCTQMCAINLFLRCAKGKVYCMNSLSLEVYGGFEFGIWGGVVPYFTELRKQDIVLTPKQQEQIQVAVVQRDEKKSEQPSLFT